MILILIRLRRECIPLLACPPNVLEQLIQHNLVKLQTRRAVMINYSTLFEVLEL
jgi:hypothetical protein